MKNINRIRGHTQKRKPTVNVKNTIKEIHHNPLFPLISYLKENDILFVVIQDEFTKHIQAYEFYFRSVERFLKNMSISRRWENNCKYVLKYRGKYSKQQKVISEKHKKVKFYLELDFFNCIIYARILMDRTISLARYFIDEKIFPSFTSFNDHKKYFLKQKNIYGKHEDYAKYIREKTEWFDVPLKVIRDKFLVHAGPKHMQIFGWPDTFNLDLIVQPISQKQDSQNEIIIINIVNLAGEIKIFLTWFAQYGLKYLKKSS